MPQHVLDTGTDIDVLGGVTGVVIHLVAVKADRNALRPTPCASAVSPDDDLSVRGLTTRDVPQEDRGPASAVRNAELRRRDITWFAASTAAHKGRTTTNATERSEAVSVNQTPGADSSTVNALTA